MSREGAVNTIGGEVWLSFECTDVVAEWEGSGVSMALLLIGKTALKGGGPPDGRDILLA